MSTLLTLTQEVTTHATATYQGVAVPVTVPMAGSGGGILDWLTAKNSQTQSVLRGLAVTLGIVFVIWQAVSSRGAMARVIIAIVAAGVFIWGVWNVTDIKDRVGNEVNASGPLVVQVTHGTGPGYALGHKAPA